MTSQGGPHRWLCKRSWGSRHPPTHLGTDERALEEDSGHGGRRRAVDLHLPGRGVGLGEGGGPALRLQLPLHLQLDARRARSQRRRCVNERKTGILVTLPMRQSNNV